MPDLTVSSSIDSFMSSSNQAGMKSAIGLGNVTNNAQLKASDLDTDSQMSADSDEKIPSQKAVKTALSSKSEIVRASGIIKGNDVAATYSVSVFSYYINGISDGILHTFNLNGSSLNLVGINDDGEPPYSPGANDVVIGTFNNNSTSPTNSSLSSVISSINTVAQTMGYTASVNSDGRLVFTANVAGSSTPPVSCSPTSYAEEYGSPTNGTNASGEVNEVELLPVIEGKTYKVFSMGAFFSTSSFPYPLKISSKLEGVYTDIGSTTSVGETSTPVLLAPLNISFLDGETNASIVGRISESLSFGDSASVWVIAQKV